MLPHTIFSIILAVIVVIPAGATSYAPVKIFNKIEGPWKIRGSVELDHNRVPTHWECRARNSESKIDVIRPLGYLTYLEKPEGRVEISAYAPFTDFKKYQTKYEAFKAKARAAQVKIGGDPSIISDDAPWELTFQLSIGKLPTKSIEGRLTGDKIWPDSDDYVDKPIGIEGIVVAGFVGEDLSKIVPIGAKTLTVKLPVLGIHSKSMLNWTPAVGATLNACISALFKESRPFYEDLQNRLKKDKKENGE